MSQANVLILLANRSWRRVQMLLRSEPDIVFRRLDPTIGSVQLLLEARSSRPAVVVLDQDEKGREPGLCTHLLAEDADLLVIVASPDGERFGAYHILKETTPIEVSGARQLRALIAERVREARESDA